MLIYVAFSIKDASYLDEIAVFVNSANKILPSTFCPVPVTEKINKSMVLCYWVQKKYHTAKQYLINPGLIKDQAGNYLLAEGYAAEGVLEKCKDDIFSLVDSLDPFTLKKSPGGVSSYAFFPVEGQSFFSWSTFPPTSLTYYAKNRAGFCVVGNRPRLVYCSSTLSLSYKPRREYFPQYICSGACLDGGTPYHNTYYVPATKALQLEQGQARIIDHPLSQQVSPLDQNVSLETKSDILADLLKNSCWPSKLVPTYSALSGGKDSRAILSALYALRVPDVHLFTYGLGEARIVARLASILNYPLSIRQINAIADPLKAAARSNSATDGLGLFFGHQYNFAFDHGYQKGNIYYNGLQAIRGAFLRTMNGNKTFIDTQLLRVLISPFVSDLCSEKAKRDIKAWRETRTPHLNDGREILDYAFKDFRVSICSASICQQYDSQGIFLRPLLDERIVRFATQLPVYDRVSECVLFDAIRKLCPDISNVPLHGDIWRFDRSPEKGDFSEGFELRQPLEESKCLSVSHLLYDEVVQRNEEKQLASYILDSSFSKELPELLHKDYYENLISKARFGNKDWSDEFQNNTFNADSFMRRLFLATTLYDITWV